MEYEWIIEKSTQREGIWVLWYMGLDHAPFFVDGAFPSFSAALHFATVEGYAVYAPGVEAAA